MKRAIRLLWHSMCSHTKASFNDKFPFSACICKAQKHFVTVWVTSEWTVEQSITVRPISLFLKAACLRTLGSTLEVSCTD